MGMFDEVRAINISHKNFDQNHNGYTFQTKDIECDMSVYCVFNGVLYQEVDNSGNGEYKRHDYALKFDYSGELNIYANIRENNIESWVEYDLTFKDGQLIDVVSYEVRVTKDNRDLSLHSPVRNLLALVQTREDLEACTKKGAGKVIAPSGDKITIFLDELT